MKIFKILLFAVCVILLTAGCSSKSTSDLVGTWYNELAYDYVDEGGWRYCEQLIFGDESFYRDYDDVGRYAMADNRILFLSGGNEGWELGVDGLSKDKLQLENDDDEFYSKGKNVVTFTRLPEIKNFEEFIQGQWMTNDENPYFDDIFEVRNDTLYIWGDEEYKITYINENILFIYDEFMIIVQKINNNKIIIYPDGCIHEHDGVEFKRID